MKKPAKQTLRIFSFCAILVFLLCVLALGSFAASESGFSDNSGGGGTRYSVDLAFEDPVAYVQLGQSVQLICYTRPVSAASTVTWSSNNTSVATINASTGVVTGQSVGTATITATAYNPGGTPYSATCTVHVVLADGVYRIKNSVSSDHSYYLNLDDSIKENTGAKLHLFTSAVVPATGNTTQTFAMLEQYWRIKHVGNGYYSIRSMAKPDMLLTRNGWDVVIKKGSTTDSLSALGSDKLWTITPYGNNYDLRLNGDDDYALMPSGGTVSANRTIVVGEYYSSIGSMHWTLEAVSNPPEGVLMYDADTGSVLITASTRAVVKGKSRTLSDLKIVPVYYNSDNISQSGFTWNSPSISTASVDSSSGKVTGGNNVNTSVNITLSKNSCTAVKYTLHVIPIENGTYFLKNKETERYVDIEDGVMSSGTQIEQDSFSGENSQRWIFTSLENGYYSIKSANSSTSYYLSVQDNSSANDQPVVLTTSSSGNGVQWKITTTASGAYKITAKCGELYNRVLAVGWYVLNVNGIDIEQRDYVEDGNYKDEWMISNISIGLLGVKDTNPDDSHDHISSLQDAESYFESVYPSELIDIRDVSYISRSDFLEMISESRVFISRSHGGSNSIGKYLCLYDLNCYSSPSLYDVSIFSDGMPRVNFEGVDIIAFVCCNSADDNDDDTKTNLIKASVNAGAKVAIGFEGEIGCKSANKWTKTFAEYLESGKTVKYAIKKAEERSGLSTVTRGDTSITLK